MDGACALPLAARAAPGATRVRTTSVQRLRIRDTFRRSAGGPLPASPDRGTFRDAYPGRVRLYLVRHAEAAPGEPDELRRLTPSGRAAARDLGRRLAEEEPPDAVLASPLLRARETAEEIARAAGVEVEPDDRLSPG